MKIIYTAQQMYAASLLADLRTSLPECTAGKVLVRVLRAGVSCPDETAFQYHENLQKVITALSLYADLRLAAHKSGRYKERLSTQAEVVAALVTELEQDKCWIEAMSALLNAPLEPAVEPVAEPVADPAVEPVGDL